MKKTLFAVIFAFFGLVFCSCGAKKGVVIEIPELEKGDVYIVYADPDMINAGTQEELAHAVIKNGRCEIKLDSSDFKGKIKECSVTIINQERQFACNLPLAVEKGKTVTLHIDGVNDYLNKKSPLKVSYSGSKYAEEFSQFWQQVNDSFMELSSNNNAVQTYEKQVGIYKQFIERHPETGFVYSIIIGEMTMIEDDNNPVLKYCEELSETKSDNVWLNYLIAAYKDRKVRAATASTLVFSAVDKDGNTVTDRDINKGKLVLIDFWATWCKPCREAIPHLQELYARYHSKGLEMVSISVDMNPNDWQKYIKSNPFQWTSLLGDGNELTQRYNFKYIPYVLIADKDGKILKKGIEVNKLEQFIPEYLNK
ncbi:MAG: TlpA family protein disulfide reductase [Bacteroidales bacterium]|nr:TlpA family protein disulfide reductase [Bacteroidales bacterium]